MKYLLIPTLIILTAAFMRLLPHPPNFAPIGALALFSGAYLDKKYRFILPLMAMIISDIFLRFHADMPFVYASFILIILIGSQLKNKVNPARLLTVSIISSVLFFIITNFGVWATSEMYTKNFSGLMQSYAMGIPFFRNTFISDLLYSFVYFYGYQFIAKHISQISPSTVKSKV